MQTTITQIHHMLFVLQLKHQVESLLQRTDSMLSRSSGRSSLHRSISNTPLHRYDTKQNLAAEKQHHQRTLGA